MEENAASRPPPGERIKLAWYAARLWLIFAIGLIGTVLVVILPQTQRDSTFVMEVGDVASQDILAPYAVSFASDVLTDLARETAAEGIPEIYDPPDNSVARQQLENLQATLDYIDAVRLDENATPEQKLTDMAALVDVDLESETAQFILDLPDSRWEAIKLETISVLEQVMRNEIREGRVAEARRTAPALVSITLPESQSTLVTQVASAFIAPNTKLNQEATEAAREQARQATDPVNKSFATGETIVSRGELITAFEIEAMQVYGLLKPPGIWQSIIIQALFVLILGCLISLYAYRVHPEQVKNIRMASILSATFIITALGIQLMIPEHTVLPYVFPAATAPMILAVLISPGMGIMTAMVTGALAGFLAPRGLELTLYVMLSGIMSALVIGRAERLSTFFWAGLASAVSAAAIIVIFRFPDPAVDILGKAELLGASILSGLLSASLGFGMLLLIGNLLGITTSLQLIELSRPDHPLLQLILQNAPGTYQHSLQVANLAEQAARAIGANPLLTRVGALYHDAGKALRPQFFIENQLTGENVHEQLDPTTSASVILTHIRDGLDLARKYRLPSSIRDFITEHHGVLKTSYQYHKALEAANGDESLLDPDAFSYPGPRPQSRETALLMLADGVEAKARADTPKEEEDIDKLARWVIEDRLSKGQLSRTDLTLKDLDTIRRSFVKTLKNVYHPRLRYPEAGVEEDQTEQPENQQIPTPPQTT